MTQASIKSRAASDSGQIMGKPSVHDHGLAIVSQALAAVTTAPLFVLDPSRSCVFANSAAALLLGDAAETMVGRNFSTFFGRADRLALERACARILAGSDAADVSVSGLAASPDNRSYLQMKPLLDADGEVTGILVQCNEAMVSAEKPVSVSPFAAAPRQSSGKSLSDHLTLCLRSAGLHAWTVDPKDYSVVADDAVFEMFGLVPSGRYARMDWAAAVHPDDCAHVAAGLEVVLKGGPDYAAEFRVVHSNGAIRIISSQMILVIDDDGRKIGVGVVGDVTERRRVEQKLHDSERELRAITTVAPIGIVRISRDLRYLYLNESHAAQLLGATPDQVVGQSLKDVLGESALLVLRPRLTDALNGRKVDFETSVHMPRGYRYIHATMTPERDDLQNIVSVVAVIEDITERKLVENRLYEREREFKTLAENAPDVIARLDRDLAYQYLNRAAEVAFGVVRERYTGRRASELEFPVEYSQATDTAVAAAFAAGTEQTGSFSVPERDDHRHFVARAVPEFDRIGLVDSVLLIVYDVSERVRVQIERDSLLASEYDARSRAEAATRGRDEFLAIVSHELRSPLNGIQSWAHVLETTLGDPPKVAQRALAGIRTGVEQQVRLIDDLLDATRIISGKLSLTRAPVRVVNALTAAIESVRGKASDKSIDLRLALDIDAETIEGDSDRVQQIVWNLLSNAIKFTPAGGHVQISARRIEDADVEIVVSDSGRGIDAAFLPHLFGRFQRDETGNSRGQDGLGLGLMLVRHLCELHQGSVTAASPGAGLGATFTLRLPLLASAKPPATAELPPLSAAALPSLSGVSVLLVDDHIESRDALAVLLARAGAEVEALGTGGEAVHRIARQRAAPQPDVLICDIAMPDKDGYETLREIRTFERRSHHPRLPAIALTAFAQNEDRVRALDAGFQMHLCKPVAVEELIVAIAAFARHSRSATSAGALRVR